MQKLIYFIQKELLLLTRDMHGLLLLFIMPTLFILIMSFALQNQYATDGTVSIDYYLIDNDQKAGSRELIEKLDSNLIFNRINSGEVLEHSKNNEENIRQLVKMGKGQFLLLIHNNYDYNLSQAETVARLEIAPSTSPLITQLFQAQLRDLLGKSYLQFVLTPILADSMLTETGEETSVDGVNIDALLKSQSLYQHDKKQQLPSSVQQNVPAWLLFAMFFIAIPLSTTLINERQQGTLARLQTMNFPHYQLFLGKLIPFFLINLLQVIAMLLIGAYLIPALGGDRLSISGNYMALAIISMAASFAAVSYALFIAQLVRTTEQATILVGACNIIMAALGGIMVPRFLMPPFMQELSELSPMAWGLDGFLDILLRTGSTIDILPEATKLISFALLLLGLSLIISKKRYTH